MKVGIDSFGCEHGRSGIGSYLYSLVQNLPTESKDFEFTLFGAEIDRYIYSGDKKVDFVSIEIPDNVPSLRVWHKYYLNKFTKKQNFDVVLYPAGSRMLPKKFAVPSVAVVNDTTIKMFNDKNDKRNNKQVRVGLEKANAIIATSNYIKNDLITLGFDEKKIKVIYTGINHNMFYPLSGSHADNDYVDIKPFAIKTPYIIYASGMNSVEKKHIELIKAFEIFKEVSGCPHRLVIAGSEGPYSEEIHRVAYNSKFASDIFITGYFPYDSFSLLYRNADACIFPSVDEGVGLPVLEAMASGVPVACSSSAALPEITGRNALFFDSDDIENMSQSIQEIVCNKELREDLVNKGFEWTKNFNWENSIKETLNLLKSVCKK